MILYAGGRVSVMIFLAALALISAAAVLPAQGADTLSEADRQRYSTAMTLLQDGYADRGLAMARRGPSHPLADKIVAWLDLGRRDASASFSELSAFIGDNPDWPGLFGLYRNAEPKLPTSYTPAEVLTWFGDRLAITGTGALRHVSALWDSGQQDRARTAAREHWVDGDFTADEERAFHSRFKSLLRTEDEVARLDRLLWAQNTGAAQRQLRRVSAGHAALARARLALADNRPGVDGLISQVPPALRDDPGLLYERAVWRQKRGRTEGVVELIDALPAGSAQNAAWWRLRNWVFWRALDRKDYALAYRVSAGHGNADGIPFADGEWQAGWVALKFLDRPAAAYEHFVRLHDGVTSEISRSRGAFWAGEAAARLGRTADSRRW
ncbi:MAG: lytic transglycosylase domain-containing protein, partial [Bacteroidota bacterium]